MGTFQPDKNGIFQGSVRYRKPRGIRPAPARPASSAQTYRDAVVSANPMSYWPLTDRGTTTASDAMHNNDGAYTNGARLGVKGPLPRTTAVLFNGKTARVKLGVVALHTVELWLKTRTKADAVAFSNRNAIHQFSTLGTYGGLAHSFDAYGVIGAAVGTAPGTTSSIRTTRRRRPAGSTSTGSSRSSRSTSGRRAAPRRASATTPI